MKPVDDDILEFLADRNLASTASGIELNIGSDVSYGEIRRRLSVLAEQHFVMKTHEGWAYYELTQAGVAYLNGELLFPNSVEENGDVSETTNEVQQTEDSGLPNLGSSDSPTPEDDLLGRYERMVQTQVETLNEIDEKAATTMRVVAVLLGVLLSLFIFLSEDHTLEVTESTFIPVLLVGIGILGLLLSLALCLYTYLSSRTLFGPKPDLGEVLSNHHVSQTDYRQNRRNTTAFRPWIRAVTQRNVPPTTTGPDIPRSQTESLQEKRV